MDKLHIEGNHKLHGTISVSGSKNAALPILTASLLSAQPLTLENVPLLEDIETMKDLLASLGVSIEDHLDENNIAHNFSRSLTLKTEEINNFVAEYDIVRKMRASVLVLGPLLARFGKATVSLPGGCAIGTRPIDLHLKALEAMGVTVALKDGYIHASVEGKLKGNSIYFESVSVGATENILMAATLAEGTTILHNAAKEPEITDLAHCLVAMGATISGIGTSTLTIEGVSELGAATHSIIPDRIEAGTLAIAAVISKGSLLLRDVYPPHLEKTLQILSEMGVIIERTEHTLRITHPGKELQPITVSTAPYPELATDMQAQFMTLMTQVDGTSHITETIFENRFMHVPELNRMGAKISVAGNTSTIHGPTRLRGAPVMATDLRASVSLVLAALAAEDVTMINRVYHLDRGYTHLVQKLSNCGAIIRRVRQTKTPSISTRFEQHYHDKYVDFLTETA